MTRPTNHRGVSLVETLSVIVVIAALAPVLSRLLSTTSASHVDSTTMRIDTVEARFALEALEVRIKTRLDDPALDISREGDSTLSFTDGSGVSLVDGALRWTRPGLTRGTLARGVDAFTITYADAAGNAVDPDDPAFDPASIARVALSIATNNREHRTILYREGVREYAVREGAHDGAWIEDFEDLRDGATIDEGDTAWTTQLNGHTLATHGVDNGAYRFSAMRPMGVPVLWRSETIDTSTLGPFNFSCSIDRGGSLDPSGDYADFIEIVLLIDNVPTTLYAGVGVGPVGLEVQSGPFVGDEAQILVSAHCTGSDEHYTIDDVSIFNAATTFGEALATYDVFAAGSLDIFRGTTHGRVAGIGSVGINEATVGSSIPDPSSGDAVSSFGPLSGRYSLVHNGDVRATSVASFDGVTVASGELITDPDMPPPVTLVEVMRTVAQQIEDSPDKQAVARDGGTVRLVGTRTLNLFEYSIDDFSSVNTVVLDIPAGSDAIVVFTGSAPSFTRMHVDVLGSDSSRLLWAYTGSGAISVSEATMHGTILAPNTSVAIDRSFHTGSVFANDIDLRESTVNVARYTGNLP